MSSLRPVLLALAVLFLTAVASPATAQGPKYHRVSSDHAVLVAKEVLVQQGFEIIGVEEEETRLTIYYRHGDRGYGRGRGRPEKLVIRRVQNTVVFEQAPTSVMVDIEVKLGVS